MFNGVTQVPNMVAFNALYPYSWVSNYGNQLQFNIMNTDVPPQMAYMAQNAINPSFWAMYNLSMSSMPVMPFNQNDMINQQALQNSYNQGFQLGETLKFNNDVQQFGSNIAALNTKLTQMANTQNITDEQKQAVEALKQKVEDFQKKYQEFLQNSQNQNLATKKEQLEALKGEYLELQEAVKALVTDFTSATNPTEGSQASNGNNNGAAAADGTGNNNGSEGAADANQGAETASNEQTAAQQNALNEYKLNQICHMLDKAISGLGTDYDGEEGMKTVLEALVTSDNVIELWNQWDKTYGKQGSYADDEDGFIETLMDECEFGQKEEIATLLIDAMEQRAALKGVDVSTEVAAARSAARSNWLGWSNSDKIQETIKALYEKLKA